MTTSGDYHYRKGLPPDTRSHCQPCYVVRQCAGPALVSVLATGVIDVCLSYPMTFESPGVKWHKLFTQQLYAVVNRDHPLAHRDVIGFEELAGQPFVALDRNHTLRRIFDDACARHGIAAKIAFEGTDITTLRGLIRARLGVGVLPKAAAAFRDTAMASCGLPEQDFRT